MRVRDQKNEDAERTLEIEQGKRSSVTSGNKLAQIDENKDKTKEMEIGKDKGGGRL